MSDLIATEAAQREPVNRSRRSKFIFHVVAFALLTAVALTTLAGFGIIATQIELVTTYVTSVLSLAGLATAVYVGGSSVDYSFGNGRMISRDHD